jgi:hypothetical protein
VGLSIGYSSQLIAQSSYLWLKDTSSIGRAPVSKTGGWGFESLVSCEETMFVRIDMSHDEKGDRHKESWRPDWLMDAGRSRGCEQSGLLLRG